MAQVTVSDSDSEQPFKWDAIWEFLVLILYYSLPTLSFFIYLSIFSVVFYWGTDADAVSPGLLATFAASVATWFTAISQFLVLRPNAKRYLLSVSVFQIWLNFSYSFGLLFYKIHQNAAAVGWTVVLVLLFIFGVLPAVLVAVIQLTYVVLLEMNVTRAEMGKFEPLEFSPKEETLPPPVTADRGSAAENGGEREGVIQTSTEPPTYEYGEDDEDVHSTSSLLGKPKRNNTGLA